MPSTQFNFPDVCPGVLAVGFSQNVQIFCWAVTSPLILPNFMPSGNYSLLFVLSKPTTSVLQYFTQVRKNDTSTWCQGNMSSQGNP